MKETFELVMPLQLENSFGVIKTEDSVKVEVTIGIKTFDSNGCPIYGWFELYDIETGGESWYAEGGLWFDGKKLTDYDGVFELLPCIIEKLEAWGYDVSEIE